MHFWVLNLQDQNRSKSTAFSSLSFLFSFFSPSTPISSFPPPNFPPSLVLFPPSLHLPSFPPSLLPSFHASLFFPFSCLSPFFSTCPLFFSQTVLERLLGPKPCSGSERQLRGWERNCVQSAQRQCKTGWNSGWEGQVLHRQRAQGLWWVHSRETRLRLRDGQRVRTWWMFEMSLGECWGLNEKHGGGTGRQKKVPVK